MSDVSVYESPIPDSPIYGLMAEFDSAQELVAAAHKTHEAGYKKIDAYSPFPIEGLAEAIGFHKNRVALVVLDHDDGDWFAHVSLFRLLDAQAIGSVIVNVLPL